MEFINRMAGQDYIDKFREYLDYTEEHLNNVNKAFEEVSQACATMPMIGDDYSWHTLQREVINHDLSKFDVEEFCAYRNSFYPVEGEKVDKKAFAPAWEHHKIFNHHHHETVTNYMDLMHMVIEAHKDEMNFTNDQIKFIYEIFQHLQHYKDGAIK